MKKQSLHLLLTLAIVGLLFSMTGCKKDSNNSTDAGTNNTGPVYPVTVYVLGPSGNPQGGASLELVNPPVDSSIFKATTDSTGKGTLMSPTGAHVILARMGSVWQATINVNVAALLTGNMAGAVTLQQNTTLGKVLVVFAGCETLEQVLRDTAIRYYKYDSTTVSQMRSQATTDSNALLTFLKQYSIVFSDCNCGDEYGFPLLARIYGRYVSQGGKMYGGHYNYYNLQFIFPPNYKVSTSNWNDSLLIIDSRLSTAVGYTVIKWSTSGYQYFTDLPAGTSTVYAVFFGTPGSVTSPGGVPVIVENRLGSGKYLWTVYHNQDILADTRLVRIVRYFLYAM